MRVPLYVAIAAVLGATASVAVTTPAFAGLSPIDSLSTVVGDDAADGRQVLSGWPIAPQPAAPTGTGSHLGT